MTDILCPKCSRLSGNKASVHSPNCPNETVEEYEERLWRNVVSQPQNGLVRDLTSVLSCLNIIRSDRDLPEDAVDYFLDKAKNTLIKILKLNED